VSDEEEDFSFCSAATVVYRFVTVVVRDSIILARSAVVGSDMAEVTEAAANGGDGGGLGKDAEAMVGCGGGAEDDKERLEPDTRLSRASNPRIAGPRLRSS
jgi:hypothetical protein